MKGIMLMLMFEGSGKEMCLSSSLQEGVLRGSRYDQEWKPVWVFSW